MKKLTKAIVAIILLGALCFLGGEWPENTPRSKVVKYDGVALVTTLVCGIYLKKQEDKK